MRGRLGPPSYRAACVVGAMFALIASQPAYATHTPDHRDARDLAARFLFNGEAGQRAYDLKGPVGGNDAIWSKSAAGQFEFSTSGNGVIVRGAKAIDVTPSCRILVNTRLAWRYSSKPSESLERSEEYDFSRSVISDAVQALKGNTPVATILIMRGGPEFYCVETRINGAVVEPKHCGPALEFVAGPGERSDIIRSSFRRFSEECRNQL